MQRERRFAARGWAVLLMLSAYPAMAQAQHSTTDSAGSAGSLGVGDQAPADPVATAAGGASACPEPAMAGEGARYLSLTPSEPSGNAPLALILTSSDFPGLFSYVDATGGLTCDPVFQTAAQWGTVHIGGRFVVPDSEYTVRALCSGGAVSLEVSSQTWKWGDANDNGVINLDDILCVLNGFGGTFTTCTLYSTDFQGFTPNGIVNLDDILVVLAAFAGQSYPGPLPPAQAVVPQPLPGSTCDDGNLCTTDTCTAGVCTHANNTASCDDHNACTTGDVCSGGVCAGTGALGCPDDGNPCTDDCHPTIGCSHTFNAAPCNDSNACTTDDICSGGVCLGTNAAATGCDDFNACTLDTCDPDLGCVHADTAGACDDGQFCTSIDQCMDGACVGSGDPCPGQICDEDNDVCLDPVLAPPTITNGPFAPTSQLMLTVMGTAAGGADVEIVGLIDLCVVPVVGGAFAANMALAENQVNPICVTTVGPAGGRSSPTCFTVVQDNQPPNLFIDFPIATSEVTTATTDAAGRVGDVLTGYLDLAVEVNGIPAEVDVGIGNNGTFFAMSVPLALGINTITAVAIDGVGNTTSKQIQVKRIDLLPTEPQMSVVSGNGQLAPMQSYLADPIVVHVANVDGIPFANKLVTFEITRSDGRLSNTGVGQGARMLQVRTNANGDATAFWRLGSDAGCGNNRVEVRSTSIAGTVVFCATATPGPPSQINMGFGNNQRTEAGAVAPEPLRVWVNDGCNGVPGETVVFNVVSGGGLVDGLPMTAVGTSVTGHAEVQFTAGAEPGLNVIEATFAGNPGAPTTFEITGIARDLTQPTRFTGVVLNNADQPIFGATISLSVGADAPLMTTTDVDGRFEINEIESAGSAELIVNGLSATMVGGQPIPQGSFPSLHFLPMIIPNAENTLGMPAVLPPLNPNNAVTFDNTQDVELTVEGIEGLKMTIRAGSMRRFDGTVPKPGSSAIVSLNQVHFDKIPMPMPNGAAPPFAWTLQPSGSTFDPPVEIELPNMAGLPADAVVYFLSFNHATNRFEIAASGHVTADGRALVTDPGSGLVTAGWGGFCPPYPNAGTVQGNPDNVDPPGPDEEPPCKSAPSASPECPSCGGDGGADPIYFFSGEFYEETEDLRIKGRGMDFVWARKYRSKTGPMTAQGNNWDFSYNLFLLPQGQDVVLCDGNSRRDVYKTQGDGSFVHRRFQRQLMQNGDQTFSLEFAEKSRWDFHAFDGSMVAGKVASITDRNGNTMGFAYDGAGRLSTITDTLGRNITVAYNIDGFLESVTDFSGRQVRYEYYQAADPGGSAGDLKSATAPAVTGTPNGNDYPDGKTTTYTYSKGFADARLNHNLLTVTDPKGQLYLTNVYSSTTNPADLNFDRVVRQIWGNQGPTPELTDTIDLVYLAQSPNSANNFSVIRVILNDRMGNVKEFFYDAQHLPTIEREFTGRAEPDQPTTATVNRPTAQLRPDDPTYFETKYRWNKESQLTRVTYPSGDVMVNVRESDLNPKAAQRSHGNVRVRVHQRGGSTKAGDQVLLANMYEYDTDFGGCCGTNFVTKDTDRKGNATTYTYDGNGNVLHVTHRIPSIVEDFEHNSFGQLTAHTLPANGNGHRRRDETTYYSSGPQKGYVHERIMDATGFALTTTFEYDAVGNVVRAIDPRGLDTQYVVNQLDQTVRELSPEVVPGSGVRYRRDMIYDANDKLVQADILNMDESGVVQTNAALTTAFEYDILNTLTRVTQEVDAGHSIVTEYEYDANRNRTLVRSGEATNGNQPTNVTRTVFDERDMAFRVIRGDGDVSKSTTQYDYDRNGNLARVSEGLEDAPRVRKVAYDIYNRPVTMTDAMGNVTSLTYDANGNRTSVRVDGEVDDLPGGLSNVRLSESAFAFDDMDRLIREDAQFFDTETQGAIGDGLATTQIFYADDSRVVRTVNDNEHETLFTYDTANRQGTVTDARGNTITNTYDAASNVVAVVEVEKSDLGGPDELFTTTFAYDGLDRLVQRVDNVGNTMTYRYDGRHNRTSEVDAKGNVVRYAYDGLNRLVRTTYLLTSTGDGSGPVTGQIVTRQTWDDASRLVGQIDDNGNTTSYVYDALNRKVREGYADGTARTFTYDVHDNPRVVVDANGSVVTSAFDSNDRRIGASIAVGAGVANDTTFENYRYDGLSRLVYAEDDDSLMIRGFDSLSRITRETQNVGPVGTVTTGTVQSSFDGLGNVLARAYPGGRTILRAYDELERTAVIADGGGSIASFEFIGPGRVARRSYANNTRTDIAYDGATAAGNAPGDYGVKKMTRTRHSSTGISCATDPECPNGQSCDTATATCVIDDRVYAWDRAMTKTRRSDVRPNSALVAQSFQYDSLYRLIGSENTPEGQQTESVEYLVDGVNNRVQVVGGGDAGSYSANAVVPQPADFQANQYTSTPFDVRLYDASGNRIASNAGLPSEVSYVYDYRNQMTARSDSTVTTTVRYDALGRRIELAQSGGSTNVIRYFHSGPSVVEEQNLVGATQATYVYGLHIDDIVNVRRGGVDYYYYTDDQLSVCAVADAAGDVVERYHYRDFGTAEILAGDGQPIAQSAIGNTRLFAGYDYDPAGGEYYLRTRYFDPRSATFATRDSIGVWGDVFNRGAGQSYLNHSPWTGSDPLGLIDWKAFFKGVWNTVREPFAEVSDLITTPIIVHAYPELSISEIPLASGLGNLQRERMLQGRSANSVALQGAVEVPLNFFTGGAYGITQAYIDLYNLYDQGLISNSELESALSEIAGGASAAAIVGKMARYAQIRSCRMPPRTVARVVPRSVNPRTLGRPGAPEVFVAPGDNIRMLTAPELNQLLGLDAPNTNFWVIEFPPPSGGLARPSSNYGSQYPLFRPGGNTIGGIPEFVIPNGPIPPNAVIRPQGGYNPYSGGPLIIIPQPRDR